MAAATRRINRFNDKLNAGSDTAPEHMRFNWEKARHGDSGERWNMQKST